MKLDKRLIIYISAIVITLGLSGGLIGWASADKGNDEEVLDTIAEVVDDHTARHEYLVGEEFDVSGLSLQISDEIVVDGDSLTAEYDFSSAGDKVVKLRYEDSGTNYLGYYQVTVFKVRHVDLHERIIFKNENDEWDYSKLVVWAELNAAPTEFEKPDDFSALKDTVIILDQSQYSVSIEETTFENTYFLHFTCGMIQSSFQFRTVDFYTVGNGSETLTLYVTESSIGFYMDYNYRPEVITASGIYALNNGNGEMSIYDFHFTLNGWTSNFESSSYNQGLSDRFDENYPGADYVVNIGNLEFFAKSSWRWAILGMEG